MFGEVLVVDMIVGGGGGGGGALDVDLMFDGSFRTGPESEGHDLKN